jgi:hypothetical protein
MALRVLPDPSRIFHPAVRGRSHHSTQEGGSHDTREPGLLLWVQQLQGPKNPALDSLTGSRVALFNPRRQRWSRHFHWSADFLLILSRTTAGRATVEALLMNRPELVNLRRLLLLIGHPPTLNWPAPRKADTVRG